VAQFHWDPDTYLELMRKEVPDYEQLQEEAAAATGTGTGTGSMRVLELGIGTGETARRVLARHPTASLIGLDASREMLDQARHALPDDRVELRVARLEDPLPDGPFDVVISTLAIHHLDGRGKAQLFRRAARVIAPGGRLVVADVIVPEDPSDVVTPIDNDYDTPSSIAEQLNWLAEVGLEPSLAWAHRDLAVIIATRPATSQATNFRPHLLAAAKGPLRSTGARYSKRLRQRVREREEACLAWRVASSQSIERSGWSNSGCTTLNVGTSEYVKTIGGEEEIPEGCEGKEPKTPHISLRRDASLDEPFFREAQSMLELV